MLSKEERDLCKSLGISEKDYLRAKAVQARRGPGTPEHLGTDEGVIHALNLNPELTQAYLKARHGVSGVTETRGELVVAKLFFSLNDPANFRAGGAL